MHSSSFDANTTINKDGGEVLVAIAALVTEGRIPGKLNSKTKGFYEGPHCVLNKTINEHKCDLNDVLCSNFEKLQDQVLDLWKKSIPVCVEVLLTCPCQKNQTTITESLEQYDDGDFLLEKWYFNISHRRSAEPLPFNYIQLINAIRSQLYFSQLTAWLTVQTENCQYKITNQNLHYRLTIPGETYESTKFPLSSIKHDFPPTDIGNGYIVTVSFLSLPRMSTMPNLNCSNCKTNTDSGNGITTTTNRREQQQQQQSENVVDDRMHTVCNMNGKHRCDDLDDLENRDKSNNKSPNFKKICHNKSDCKMCNNKPSTSSSSVQKPKLTIDVQKTNDRLPDQQIRNSCTPWEPNLFNNNHNNNNDSHNNDLKIVEDKGKLLLDAIVRSGQRSTKNNKYNKYLDDDDDDISDKWCDDMDDSFNHKNNNNNNNKNVCDYDLCDMRERRDSGSTVKGKSKFDVFIDKCDRSNILKLKEKKVKDVTNLMRSTVRRTLNFNNINNNDDEITKICDNNNKNIGEKIDIPSASEQAKFRKELDNAASMVFHSMTGLPLTSSPAPVRRGKSCFDYDSTINSVSAIKSALFPTSVEDECESDASTVSPCSPGTCADLKRPTPPIVKYRKGDAANLLGNFEESVLNGRLQPDSTVHGFSAKVGASGSFVPNQLSVPVTVFFYALIDNDKLSSPYLGHINLGRRGYNIPRSGTVQVTLLNPHGTVVKMFVVMYNLNDMPANSTTFIRQRVVYLPASLADKTEEWMEPKWLRYLIHLRFVSSKSGKIYLYKDIRLIVFRKTDMDTAVAFNDVDVGYELRSFNQMPNNPRFSPRK